MWQLSPNTGRKFDTDKYVFFFLQPKIIEIAEQRKRTGNAECIYFRDAIHEMRLAWEVFSSYSNVSYVRACHRSPRVISSGKIRRDEVHHRADGRSTIAPYSQKMEYRWAGLSLLLGAGAVSLLLLRILFPRSVMTAQTQFSFLCQEWKMKIRRIRMTDNLIERTNEIVDLLAKLWLLLLLCFPFFFK